MSARADAGISHSVASTRTARLDTERHLAVSYGRSRPSLRSAARIACDERAEGLGSGRPSGESRAATFSLASAPIPGGDRPLTSTFAGRTKRSGFVAVPHGSGGFGLGLLDCLEGRAAVDHEEPTAHHHSHADRLDLGVRGVASTASWTW
jgi:hypothetical protein